MSTAPTGTVDVATGPLSEESAAEAFGLLFDEEEHSAASDEDNEENDDDDDDVDPGEADVDEEQDEDEADEVEDVGDDTTDEDDPTEGDDDALIPVKIDGKMEKVTLDELKKGYSRTKVFTQKTMELADKRKAAEAEVSAIAAERAHVAQLANDLLASLQNGSEKEPDWNMLRETDPVEWSIQKQVWADRRSAQAEVVAKRDALLQQNATAQAKAQAVHLESERELMLDKMPAWKKDPARAKKDLGAVQEFMMSQYGFSPDEAAQIYDHRAVIALYDAMQFRRGVEKQAALAKAGKVVVTETKGPKVLTPKSGRTRPTKTKARDAALQRVQATGRTDDAAAAFRALDLF